MSDNLKALTFVVGLVLASGCGGATNDVTVGEAQSGDLVPLTAAPPGDVPSPGTTTPVDSEVAAAAAELIGRAYDDPQQLDPNDAQAVPRMLGLADGYELVSTQPMWGAEGPVGMVVTLQYNAAPDKAKQTIVAFVQDPDPAGAIWGQVVSTLSVRLQTEEQLSTVHQGCRIEKAESPDSIVIGVINVAAGAGAEQHPRAAWLVNASGSFTEVDPVSVICSLSNES